MANAETVLAHSAAESVPVSRSVVFVELTGYTSCGPTSVEIILLTEQLDSKLMIVSRKDCDCSAGLNHLVW